MAERVPIAALQAHLERVTKERDEARYTVDLNVKRGDAAENQLVEQTAKVKELTARNEAQAGEIRTLNGQLRAYKGSATRAKNDATVLRRALSPEARAIGAIAAPADDGARHRARVAFEDALREGPIQIVFSDGKREIRELAALIVTGDAWRVDTRGFTLRDEPLLEPGEMVKPEVVIAGVAALDEQGNQVSWQPWVEAVRVPRNGHVKLTAGHIRFNF